MAENSYFMSSVIRDRDRLAALRATGLLDSPTEPSFDRLVALAARVTGAPTALVTLVDEDRQFFVSCRGLTGPPAEDRGTPLSHSFCQHVVISGQPLIIEDARLDLRVKENLAIRDYQVIAYAGIPLFSRNGQPLGSFCVIDEKPRAWSDADVQNLNDLAASVMTEIELRFDMRERSRTESALRESEARFRGIVEAASDIIYGTNWDGFFTYVNPVAAKIMGYPSEKLIGMHFTELVRADAREETARFYGRQFNEKIEHTYYEFPAINAAGRDVWIGQKVRLVLENGLVAGAQAVARDITERREIDRMKDEFVSIVSHELRTPLTSLRGSLGLLSSGRLKQEQVQRMVEIAVGNTDRLIRLINDFLDLECVKSGKIKLAIHPYDITEIVRSAVDNVMPEAARLDVDIRIDAEKAVVHVDADRMVQVAVNLLSNAVKFSNTGGVITLVARREETDFVMQVRDEGRGIPVSDLQTIFQPFHQVDASDSRDKGGTGLGLPICQSIVEQHGGTIKVDSTVGAGSTFTVRIPQ